MDRRSFLDRLLHNDKLMMIISLVLAFLIWVAVEAGAGNNMEHEITGVPISITLNEFVSQSTNLRIVEGAEATATVKVKGPRSIVGALSAQDLTVVADTGHITKEGTYVLQLRARANSDVEVLSVVGQDGATATTTIVCDVWSEQSFPVTVEMPNLKVSDTSVYQFGTPSISGTAVSNNNVLVSGPRTDINHINRIVAKIPDNQIISETAVFTAELIAYNEHGVPITTVSVVGAEDAKLSVTVPVMVYHKIPLNPVINNTPAGYKDNQNLVTVTPKEIELWSVPSEVDEYINKIKQQLVVDFNQLDKSQLTREFTLESTQSVRLLNTSETVTVKVNLSNITTRTYDVSLSEKNIRIENCPENLDIALKQTRLPNIRICGPSNVVNRIKAADIVLVLDMTDQTTAGQRVLKAKLELPKDTAWVCYDNPEGFVEVQVEVTAI